MKSWRWFSLRVAGILSTPESMLAAYFAPSDPTPTGD